MSLPLDEEGLRRLRHDLRSPLVVIGGFAHLLAGERAVTDDERREFAGRIVRAAQEMERLIEEAFGGA